MLKRLKRRSLALLRKEIEPVEPAALARFSIGWHGIRAETPTGANALFEAVNRLAGAPVPASTLERDVLSSRVVGPQTGLDRLLADGELIWVGSGALGARDGRVALYPRDRLGLLWRGPDPEADLSNRAEANLDFLRENGASFFRDMYEGTAGGDPEEALEALWDLVWAGYVTNDTLEPLRAYGRQRSSRQGRRPLSSRFSAHSAGRWSEVSAMVRSQPPPTERHAAWAQLLLDRHGVVARSTALAENYPGGFTNLYPVLGHLEESGRIRRGYFVEGLGGSQFALPGAVDLLRSERRGGIAALSATDPANPYGSILPWPESPEARLARDAGAYVVTADGDLVAYLDKGRRGLTLFDTDPAMYGEISRILASVAARHRRLTLLTVNGNLASSSPLAPALTEWGFAAAPRGLTYRG